MATMTIDSSGVKTTQLGVMAMIGGEWVGVSEVGEDELVETVDDLEDGETYEAGTEEVIYDGRAADMAQDYADGQRDNARQLSRQHADGRHESSIPGCPDCA